MTSIEARQNILINHTLIEHLKFNLKRKGFSQEKPIIEGGSRKIRFFRIRPAQRALSKILQPQ